MKKHVLLTLVIGFGLLSITVIVPVCEVAEAQGQTSNDFVPATVFQAAGPTTDSIQGTVDEFRAALGEPNNLDNIGPLKSGRREINWDGTVSGVEATTPPATPFNSYLNERGGQFTTPGIGLSQAPPSANLQGGLCDPPFEPIRCRGLEGVFNNPTYGAIFSAFSPLRLFTPVGSNITEAFFFVPGFMGKFPATVRGFGAVFTDVDEPNGVGPRLRRGNPRGASTLMEYFDRDGTLIFSGFVPASPGDGSLSFFGIVFEDARVARVRITTGNVPPGPNDDSENDIVMMDDFIYGEPQPLSLN